MSALPFVKKAIDDDTSIANLIDDRVFYSVAPQSTPTPYVVLVQSGGSEPYMLAGASGWPEGDVQTIVVGSTFIEVEEVGEALIAALKNWRGTWNNRLASIRREAIDSFDHIPSTDQHRRIIGFSVDWKEPL